jgi:hypothetical protein
VTKVNNMIILKCRQYVPLQHRTMTINAVMLVKGRLWTVIIVDTLMNMTKEDHVSGHAARTQRCRTHGNI